VYFLYSNKLVNIPEIHVKDLSFDDDQGIVYFRIEPAQSVCETEWHPLSSPGPPLAVNGMANHSIGSID
jgi:hypothetical protein